MLKTFPETVLDYAVDGVVQASSLGVANDHQRLLTAARERARQACERARQESDALRARALADGYQQGLAAALQGLLPVLDVLQQNQQQLLAALREQVHDRLQAMARDPALLVPQWAAACAQWVDGAATPARLHVPQDQPALLAALQVALADSVVQVCAAARQTPLLEVGGLAYQLELPALLMPAVDAVVHQALPQWQPVLADLASGYADTTHAALLQAQQRHRYHALSHAHED